MELLPILSSQSATQLLCEICPKPGNCCREFELFELHGDEGEKTFWERTWLNDAKLLVLENELPFEPLRIRGRYIDPGSGDAYVGVTFWCPKLTAAGRCSIYETRPDTCRNFIPSSSGGLCVFSSQELL